MATSSGRYTKFFNNLVLSKNNKCRFDKEYFKEVGKVKEFIGEHYKNKVILASGGVIQQIMQPGIVIYPPNTMVALPKEFDIIVFLRNGAGDTYPWDKNQVEEAIKRCDTYAKNKILDTEYFYLATGEFPSNCVNVFPWNVAQGLSWD